MVQGKVDGATRDEAMAVVEELAAETTPDELGRRFSEVFVARDELDKRVARVRAAGVR